MNAAPDTAFLDACGARLRSLEPVRPDGRVRSVVGVLLEAEGVSARLGATCVVEPEHGRSFEAEVVGFRDDRVLLMPLSEHRGVSPGARIRLIQNRAEIWVGESCLGRVLDALGRPLDGGAPLETGELAPLHAVPESALTRERVRRPLPLGIRAIDGLATVGRGARIGVFAGAGVGKSTLLGQIARNTAADVRVIALIGERRREVREFIEGDLGDALAQSVVIVASSDEAPLQRVRAAHTAMAISEHFRSQGREVLLIMDSLSRLCAAWREVGLATGEPPTTRGYTPSVWSALPKLLERAGTSAGGGSVTGVFSVLVEGDDMNEPVADAARSLLDGHVVLSRTLAERGHYPAIDVLASVSRVMPAVISPEHKALALRAREALATYRDAEDLISIGAYVPGSDPAIDKARALHEPLREFLRQEQGERKTLDETRLALHAALGAGESAPPSHPQNALVPPAGGGGS